MVFNRKYFFFEQGLSNISSLKRLSCGHKNNIEDNGKEVPPKLAEFLDHKISSRYDIPEADVQSSSARGPLRCRKKIKPCNKFCMVLSVKKSEP